MENALRKRTETGSIGFESAIRLRELKTKELCLEPETLPAKKVVRKQRFDFYLLCIALTLLTISLFQVL